MERDRHLVGRYIINYSRGGGLPWRRRELIVISYVLAFDSILTYLRIPSRTHVVLFLISGRVLFLGPERRCDKKIQGGCNANDAKDGGAHAGLRTRRADEFRDCSTKQKKD